MKISMDDMGNFNRGSSPEYSYPNVVHRNIEFEGKDEVWYWIGFRIASGFRFLDLTSTIEDEIAWRP